MITLSRTVAVCALLGVLLTPAAAPAANNLIVVNRSVDGIPLSATQSKVKQRLGKPSRTFKRTLPAGGGLPERTYLTWDYAKRKLSITFVKMGADAAYKVQMFEIRGRTEHTRSGVRVGSSLEDVKQKLPGATCKPGYGGSVQCLVPGGGTGPTGGREFLTQFSVESGKVRAIVMSRSLTWNLPAPG